MRQLLGMNGNALTDNEARTTMKAASLIVFSEGMPAAVARTA